MPEFNLNLRSLGIIGLHHIFSIALVLVPCAALLGQSVGFESPPIDYLNAPVSDPVAKLADRLAAGTETLKFDDEHGYLPSVLAALDIPISSQVLVFSKTSLQLHRISPRRPRAVYFNDDVYVGWCQQGDVVELAATDPKLGAIFYTLAQTDEGQPKFVRDRGQCLTCHASSRTQNVPGYLVRSVFADRAGYPILGSGTYVSDHTSPFAQRFGGWYVTGSHGQMRHMGNATSKSDTELDRESGANRESLDGLLSTKPYLSPHSDLVALMVMEHQTQVHNALTAASIETRLALHQSFQMNEWLERERGTISDSAHRRIAAVADKAVTQLLMCNEFKLEDQIAGTSEFSDQFISKGIKDSKGRSLRDLDCSEKLFRYPCSFLIYSEAFTALPSQVHDRIVSQIVNVLTGQDQSEKFAHLSPVLRTEILEILQETHPSFTINVTQ